MKFTVFCFVGMASTVFCMAETNLVTTADVLEESARHEFSCPTCRSFTITNATASCSTPASDRDRVDWLERRMDAAERNLSNCYAGLKSNIDQTISAEIKTATKDAEEEYKERYGELKDEQDRFLARLGVALTVVGCLVALLGIGFPVFNEWRARNREKESRKAVQTKLDEYEELKTRLSKEREFDRCQTKVDLLGVQADAYFQLARVGFEQYKVNPIAQVLEIVVKQLSKCIQYNISTRDGKNLKAAISLLNTAMNKNPGPDLFHPERLDLPPQIVADRKVVAENLQSWEWKVRLEDVRRVLAEAEVDSDALKWSVSNLEKVIVRCSGNADSTE